MPGSVTYISRMAWFMWFLGGLFYFYQFILRGSVNVLSAPIMQTFGIKGCTFGIIAACYYYAYSLFQIPAGIALDRLGPRRVLCYATFFCATGALGFALAFDLWSLGAARALIGIGSAGAFLGSIRLATLWFPPERLAFIVGLTMIMGTLGGISGNLPLAFLAQYFDWRTSIFVVAMLGGVLWLLIYSFAQEAPQVKENARTPFCFREVLYEIILRANTWFLALYGALMYVPLSVFTDTWSVAFLMKRHDINVTQASFSTSLLLVGVALGSPLTAFISDWLQKRRLILICWAFVSCILNALLVFYTGLTLYLSWILLFCIGVAFTAQPLVFSIICETTKSHLNGTATGILNSIVMLVGASLQPMVGYILDYVWDGRTVEGMPYYTIGQYRVALLMVPLCLGIATLIGCFIPSKIAPEKPKAS